VGECGKFTLATDRPREGDEAVRWARAALARDPSGARSAPGAAIPRSRVGLARDAARREVVGSSRVPTGAPGGVLATTDDGEPSGDFVTAGCDLAELRTGAA